LVAAGFLLGLVCFLLGEITTGSFLMPTLLRYGSAGLGGTGSLVQFHPSNLGSAFVILAQLLSLASAEVPRFLGRDLGERLAFFKNQNWAVPFAVVALLLGLLQPIVMLISGFSRRHYRKDWGAVRVLTLSTFLLIYASFAFAVKSPKSHMYYLMLPVMMLFAFYVFSSWSSKRWFLTIAGVLLVSNVGFHVGMAASHYREKSLYAYRESISRAIEEKDYTQMGVRRPEARY
jgi:hypothetical protein